jgi:RimJ/RimL family protein N-acetyltransferase
VTAGGVQLREVTSGDLEVFYEHQREPAANRMAAFPARDRDAFMAHWEKILGEAGVTTLTIVSEGRVTGSIACWHEDGMPLVGYWIGQEHWGRGIATRALAAFVGIVTERPLRAYVAKENGGSIRVLEKCGFAVVGEQIGAPADGEPVIEVTLELH